MSRLRTVRALTVAEIQTHWDAVLAELRAGGTILVEADADEAVLGALPRDAAVIGEAEIAELLEAGHVAPLDHLRAVDGGVQP